MTDGIRSTSSAERARAIANPLIYASIVLGVFLLVQLYAIVPWWLVVSVAAGWAAYLAVGIAVWRGRVVAYPIALVLAVLTLGVSVPQPEHASLLQSGFSLASLTLLAGSILQVGVILSISIYLILTRRERRRVVSVQ
jgi:phosphoglycerol transferase MdoB-like AlkP superfamily enzyme